MNFFSLSGFFQVESPPVTEKARRSLRVTSLSLVLCWVQARNVFLPGFSSCDRKDSKEPKGDLSFLGSLLGTSNERLSAKLAKSMGRKGRTPSEKQGQFFWESCKKPCPYNREF